MSALTEKTATVCAFCEAPFEPGETIVRHRVRGKFTGRSSHVVCPIPTRPVQKHFSEAGEKGSGIPWPIYVKIALIALVAGALAAVVIFMTGVA